MRALPWLLGRFVMASAIALLYWMQHQGGNDGLFLWRINVLDDDALRQFYPYFLTPCYGGQVTVNFTTSMLALLQRINDLKLQSGISVQGGSSLVTRARNEGMIEFLQDRKYTHLFWIDGDIGFEPETALRLLRTEKDVVAGAYPVKRFHWPDSLPAADRNELLLSCLRYPVNAAANGKAMPLTVDADGLLEVSEAPTGFMCIKRGVFDRMIQELPDLKYVPDMKRDDPRRDWCYRFFDVLVEPVTNRYLSEDYAFCHRWRQLGGKVFIDTTAKLTHAGSFIYAGDFGRSLQLNPAMAIGLPPE